MGIDPGSHVTGFGVVEGDFGTVRHVASGTIPLDPGLPLCERLWTLHQEVTRLAREHGAEEAAVERVFVARNADSALKLGHVRGVVLLSLHEAGLRVYEYTPAQVKKTVAGRGRATKAQMIAMVRLLLSLDAPLAEDEADALAIAFTHLLLCGEQALLAEAMDRL